MCMCVALAGAVSSLPALSHSLGQVLVQGVATSHLASAEDGRSEFVLLWLMFM